VFTRVYYATEAANITYILKYIKKSARVKYSINCSNRLQIGHCNNWVVNVWHRDIWWEHSKAMYRLYIRPYT